MLNSEMPCLTDMTLGTKQKNYESRKLVCMIFFSPILILVICIAAWRPMLVPYSYEYVKMVASHVSNDTKKRLDNELLCLKAEWKFYEMERKFGQHWCHENEDRSRKNVSWLTVMVSNDFVVPALVPDIFLSQDYDCAHIRKCE